MRFKINADDYGLTKGITDKILDCIDNGKLNSISLIPNGMAFDYAVAELKRRPGISMNIHINLVEGRALSDPEEIPCLARKDGFFYHSFFSLLMTELCAGNSKKAQLKKQLAVECNAQISRVFKAFDYDINPGLDSHMHFHMIPSVFDVLNEIACKKRMPVRLPLEPFFICMKCFNDIRNYLGANIVKHGLLKLLSIYNRRKAERAGCIAFDNFIGVLFTGRITLPSIIQALKKIPDNGIVEILFHPGYGNPGEEAWLRENTRFTDFYFSFYRKQEHQILKSMELKEIINKYERENYEIIHYS